MLFAVVDGSTKSSAVAWEAIMVVCEKRLIFGFSGKVKKFWDRKNGPILRSHDT